MKFALDIATILFLGTGAIGVLLLGRLLWSMFLRPHGLPSNPWPSELPVPAVDAVQQALDNMRRRFYAASGDAKTRLGYEVRRLEHRLTQVSDNVGELQQAYRHIGMKRLDLWKQWKDLLTTLEQAHSHHQRTETRAALASAEMMYKQLTRDLEAERQRYLARNKLIVSELQQQGVLAPPDDLPTSGAPPKQAAEQAAHHPEAHGADAPETSADAALQEALPPNAAPAEGSPAAPASGTTKATAPGDDAAPLPRPDLTPLHQAQMFDPAVVKQGRRYGDTAFSLGGLRGGIAAGLDFGEVSFTHVRFEGLHRYRECHFSHANLRGISLAREERPHQFFRCSFAGTDWRDAQLQYTVFNQCDMSGTRWEGAKLELVRFHECDLAGVDWGGASLHRCIMSEDMLADVDFSTASAPPRNYSPPDAADSGDPGSDAQAGGATGDAVEAKSADPAAQATRTIEGAPADMPAAPPGTEPKPPASPAAPARPAAPRRNRPKPPEAPEV